MSDVQLTGPLPDYIVDEIAKEMEPDIEAALAVPDDLPDDAGDDEREEVTQRAEPEKPFTGSLTLKDGNEVPFDDLTHSIVTLPDRTQVTFAEWQKGAMLGADYTRKTQALSAEKNSVEQLRQFAVGAAQTSIDLASVAMKAIDACMPPRPDVRLAETNINAYLMQKDQYEQGIETRKRIAAQAAQIMQAMHGLSLKGLERRQAEELAKLQQVRPALKEGYHLRRVEKQVSEWLASDYGIGRNEVPPDHRVGAVLYDLNQYKFFDRRRGQSNSPQNGPRVQQPGARRNVASGEAKAKRDAWARLNRGDKDAGAELIEDILGNG